MTDKLTTLRAEFQPLARSVLAVLDKEAAKQGLAVRAVQGFRSWAEQAALYAQGRTKPGPRVTNARPGTSWHNYGLAFDVGLFTSGGAYLGNHPLYTTLATKVDQLNVPGLHSGSAFNDLPHVQFSDTYGLAVPSWVTTRYAARPFDLPISIPRSAMPDPLDTLTPEQHAAWMKLLMEGVFTRHTKPRVVVTTEMAGVFLSRLLEAASRP